MSLLLGFSLGIGLLLGMLGGGGSVLMVPMLVYLVGMPAKTAMATSLVVVGVTSAIAMLGHARGGRVCWKTGALFALAGMAGSYGGGRLAAFVSGTILLLLFGVIMLATAIAMLRGRKAEPAEGAAAHQALCPLRLPILPILFDGVAVGTLTGLVGAGGGFLVVPALNLLGGLPMRAAVGTSLLVVALQSFSALAGYASHVELDLHVTSLVATATIAGSLVGGRLSQRGSPAKLRRGFGAFVAMVGAYLLYRELTPAVVADIAELAQRHHEYLWGVLTVIGAALLLRLRSLLRYWSEGADGPQLPRHGKLR
ncbi:MAG: sulfite exporter TauE/SafE family protein [Methylococcaceae bacterium]|nr:sulfite exporter TauE/SafE family protein [Methylococcaceae bacterium]